MIQNPTIARSSAAKWSLRIVIALTALVVAYFVSLQTLGNALTRRAEAQAFALAPWDARIMARYARDLVKINADRSQIEAADALARKALAGEGTSIDAVATLGMTAQLRGDDKLARLYFGYAEKLSRRDLPTQLWAIEDAVSRGDVPGAIEHYDIALRTSRRARDILFPILTSAISDPVIRAAAVDTLATRPRWSGDFLFFLAESKKDPLAAADLIRRLKPRAPISSATIAVLIDSLIAKGAVHQAWSFYAETRADADIRKSRDPHFAAEQGSRSPFDWQLFGDGGIATSIQWGGEGNVFVYSLSPGARGLLLRQMQLLPPGTYILRGKNAKIAQPASSRPFWELTCLDGRVLGRAMLPNSDENGAGFGGSFEVPPSCPVQNLSLVTPRHGVNGGGDGEIYEAILLPREL